VLPNAGQFCDGCACRNCQNLEANEAVVLHMRQQILARSPNAFDLKARKLPLINALDCESGKLLKCMLLEQDELLQSAAIAMCKQSGPNY